MRKQRNFKIVGATSKLKLEAQSKEGGNPGRYHDGRGKGIVVG